MRGGRSNQYYLVFDAGTSNIKAFLLEEAFRLVDRSFISTPLCQAVDGWAEVDMGAYWRAFCQLSRTLLERNADCSASLSGVYVTGQGDGLWPVEKPGDATGRAITWQDTRSGAEGADDPEGLENLLVDHNCNRSFPGSRISILSWLKKHDSERYKKIVYPLHCVNWLNFQLTGVRATDPSNCSTEAFDLVRGEYVEAIFRFFDLKDIYARLPAVHPPESVIGYISEQASRLTSIPTGVPVFAGCLDITAVNLGAGIERQGDSCIEIGTSLIVSQYAADLPGHFSDPVSFWVKPLLNDQGYLRMMGATTGGALLQYVRDTFFPDSPHPSPDESRSIPAGSEGLICLPFLKGERAPFVNPQASAGFIGVRPIHSRLHYYRAAMEAIAFSLFHCLQSMRNEPHRVVIGGGASRNDALCEIISDLIQSPVLRYNQDISIALGCAKMMDVKRGRVPGEDPEAREVTVFEPCFHRAKAYRNAYRQYLELVDLMQAVWKE